MSNEISIAQTSQPVINFNDVYNTYYKEIVSFVAFKVHSNIIAEELVNDSFMKLYHNLDSFDPKKSKLRTWLFYIVNNTVIDYYRKISKDNNKISIDNNSMEGKKVFEIKDDSNNIFDVMSNNDIKNNVISCINKLSNNNLKKVANLYFIDDLSYNEISDCLEIPLGSVKGYINRIRLELQKELRKKEVYV